MIWDVSKDVQSDESCSHTVRTYQSIWYCDMPGKLVDSQEAQFRACPPFLLWPSQLDLTLHNWTLRSGSKKTQFLNDNCSQESIFQYWGGCLQGQAHINQTCPDVVRMSQWRQFHCLPPRGGIERVFFADGKQNHALKKNTMNKTLENTLKVSINTKLKFVDLWGQKSLHRWWSHIQETQVFYGVRGLVGDRGRRRWLWCGLTQWL